MPARKYTSTAEAKTLSVGINSSITTMTLNTVTTLPSLYPYTLVIDPDTAYEEIVTVSSLASGVLTIIRGQDGTSAQSHNAGAAVRHMITARDLQEPQDHIYDSSDIHGLATAGPAGASGGVVVGTTASQTLTNKTIASPVITGTISGTGVVTSANIVDGTIINADISSIAGIVDTKLATITTDGKVANSATTATVNNTGSTIVLRNSAGNFNAGTITADLSGNASSASVLNPGRSINGVAFNGSAAIRTHNGGSGTTSATAVETITHGFSSAPSAVSVTLKTTEQGNFVRTFYITRIGATTFDIRCNDSTGNQVAAGYCWIAVV
jgi:hypothetical protein